MRFHREIVFHGGVEAVRSVLLDPAFRDEVAREAGALEVSVEVTDRADGTVLASVATAQPTDGFPAVARRVLGSSLRITQTEHWTEVERAALDVAMPGQPGKVTGIITLRGEGARTTQAVMADIRVPIPFVGSKVEEMIGASLGYVLTLQATVGNRWLAK